MATFIFDESEPEGNIFHIIYVVGNHLKSKGKNEEANNMFYEVMCSESYDKAIDVIGQYVDIEVIRHIPEQE